jgi:hypothetical protein
MGATVQRTYDLKTVEAGLLALASWRGSPTNASRTLAEQGIKIPKETLQTWKKVHAARYHEIEAEILPHIRQALAAHQELIARRASEVALDMIELTATQMKEIPARDLPSAVRNMEVTAATATDKHSILHGLPSEIRQTDSAEDILKRLEQKHPGMFVNSTAEEITEAKVVE